MNILKNPRVQLLGAALALVLVGMYFHIDIPALLDNLSVVAEKLSALTAEEAPIE